MIQSPEVENPDHPRGDGHRVGEEGTMDLDRPRIMRWQMVMQHLHKAELPVRGEAGSRGQTQDQLLVSPDLTTRRLTTKRQRGHRRMTGARDGAMERSLGRRIQTKSRMARTPREGTVLGGPKGIRSSEGEIGYARGGASFSAAESVHHCPP